MIGAAHAVQLVIVAAAVERVGTVAANEDVEQLVASQRQAGVARIDLQPLDEPAASV